MYRYYIPEINMRDIRNNTDLLINLENKFNKTTKLNIPI